MPHQLNDVRRFLEAIGRTDRVAFTCYSGDGAEHLSWSDDGAAAVEVTDENLENLWKLQLKWKGKRQLGYYGGTPLDYDTRCSKKAGVRHFTHLRTEADQLDQESQLMVLHEFEHIYGVKFTLVDTGNKSIHAYLALFEPVEARYFKAVQLKFEELLNDVASSNFDLDYVADRAVFGPAQAMRLPGAVHVKTGQQARVIQFGEPCSLEDIGIDDDIIREALKNSSRRAVIERHCGDGMVMGYSGEEGLDVLTEVCRVWTKREPGAGTYSEAVLLVRALTGAIGAESAAELLFFAGHNDRDGNHSRQGLLDWCNSFSQDWPPAECKAFLLSRAERVYGLQLKLSEKSLALAPTEIVPAGKHLKAAFARGGAICNGGTGTGKSKGSIGHVVDVINDGYRDTAGMPTLSIIVSPRVAINEQISATYGAVNLSGGARLKGRHPYFLVCCPQSLGEKGDQLREAILPGLWTPSFVKAGNLVLDELRQTMEMLFLGGSGKGGLFEDPAARRKVLRRLLITIALADNVYALDAQMGAVERDLLRVLGRPEAERILGVIPEYRRERLMYITKSPKQWREKLFLQAREPKEGDDRKPVLVICGQKGDDKSSIKGVSIGGLARWIPGSQTVTRDNRDNKLQRRILRGEGLDCIDAVLGSPCMQSGYSFIGSFQETVYCSDGGTMPPNVTGGQACPREREVKTAWVLIADYRPHGLPFWGDPEQVREQLRASYEAHQIQIEDHIDQVIFDFTERYASRYMEEMSLFRTFTEGYARLDGWDVEEAPEHVEQIPPPEKGKAAPKRTEPLAWGELPLDAQMVFKALRGEVDESELRDYQRSIMEDAVGIDTRGDLLGFVSVLRDSGLLDLEGRKLMRGDPELEKCGAFLIENRRILVGQRFFRLRLTGGKSDDLDEVAKHRVRAVTTVTTALGGAAVRSGRNGRIVEFKLPST